MQRCRLLVYAWNNDAHSFPEAPCREAWCLILSFPRRRESRTIPPPSRKHHAGRHGVPLLSFPRRRESRTIPPPSRKHHAGRHGVLTAIICPGPEGPGFGIMRSGPWTIMKIKNPGLKSGACSFYRLILSPVLQTAFPKFRPARRSSGRLRTWSWGMLSRRGWTQAPA